MCCGDADFCQITLDHLFIACQLDDRGRYQSRLTANSVGCKTVDRRVLFMCMSVEYYRRNFQSQVTVEVTVATARVPGQSTTREPSLEYSHVIRPLFWMSLLSMLVAFVWIIAIVVLYFKSRSSKVRRPACTFRPRPLPAIPLTGVRASLCDDVDDDADADGYNELTSVIVSRE